jgi:hypothetical protein
MLPTIDFFGNQISRLIVGGNPFSGHTYIPDEVSSEEMLDYYTAENTLKALFEAEELGYSTFLTSSDNFLLRVIRQYRNEGGKMNWIAQTYPAVLFATNVNQIMKCDPIAIFHQGTMTDTFYEAGDIAQLRENIKIIRDSGKPTGMSTHVPEVIQRAEEEDWGIDFYMACVHNMRKHHPNHVSSFITGKRSVFEFYAEDRALMFDTIKQTKKPCIAFKILSGGHLCNTKEQIEEAFRETYSNIKPYDAAVVGIYQGRKNQLAENAEIVKRILDQ